METYVEQNPNNEAENSYSYTELDLGNNDQASEEETTQEYFDLPLNERIKIRSKRLKEKMDIKAEKFKIVAEKKMEKAKIKSQEIHLKMQDKFAKFQQKRELKYARREEKRNQRMQTHVDRENAAEYTPDQEVTEELLQSHESFKYCPQCGNHVSLDGRFCPTCGISQ
ncbi:MAG: hypothetical protein ACTSWW_12805 [Promethearchaeota archaeon]